MTGFEYEAHIKTGYGNYENMWWLSVALGIIAFLLTITVKEDPFTVNSEVKQTS